MITVHHVLKDGTEVDSIEGKVIKAEDHSVLYELINRIQKEGDQKQHEVISASD